MNFKQLKMVMQILEMFNEADNYFDVDQPLDMGSFPTDDMDIMKDINEKLYKLRCNMTDLLNFLSDRNFELNTAATPPERECSNCEKLFECDSQKSHVFCEDCIKALLALKLSVESMRNSF